VLPGDLPGYLDITDQRNEALRTFSDRQLGGEEYASLCLMMRAKRADR
jgi:hypothetical protein